MASDKISLEVFDFLRRYSKIGESSESGIDSVYRPLSLNQPFKGPASIQCTRKCFLGDNGLRAVSSYL